VSGITRASWIISFMNTTAAGQDGHLQTGRRHQWLTHSSILLGEFLRSQAVERVALGVLRVLATTTATHWRRRTRVHGNFSQFETRALPTPSGVAIRVRLVHASGR
jgi:hypothetical protein